MEGKKRIHFNVPINGISERYMSMEELLCAFRSCKATDPEVAQTIVEYACDCGSIEAKLAYSNFLRTTPKLSMPQAERYKKAEQLLIELLNILDMPDKFTANVALELGALYADCLHRPVGALSLYLQANRLGAIVEDDKVRELQKKMEKMDINHFGSNCVDALRLGREIHHSGGAHTLAELFLREAVDKAAEELSEGRRYSQSLYGQACLALGDFYDSRIANCTAHERIGYQIEKDRMYSEAKANGHPEYLSRSDYD